MPVSERASSPAFVSRVSPTVSSRADAQQLGGQQAAALGRLSCFRSVTLRRRARLAALGAAAIIEPDPRARTDLEHSPGRSEREPRTTLDRRPPAAQDRRLPEPPPAPPPGGPRQAAAQPARPARRRSARPARRSSWRTSSSPRPRPVRSRARSARSRRSVALAIVLVIFAVFLLVIGDVAVPRGVAARLDGLGRAPRRPAVHRRSPWRRSSPRSASAAGGSAGACWSSIVVAVVVGVVLGLDLLEPGSTPRSARRPAWPSTRDPAAGRRHARSARSIGLLAGIVGGRPDAMPRRRSRRRTRRADRPRRRSSAHSPRSRRAAGRRRHRHRRRLHHLDRS